MSDPRETVTPEPNAAGGPPVPESEPAFLARARRILAGNIRPDDYLPVTPEVQARVDRDMAFAATHIRKQFEAKRIPAVFEPDTSVPIRQRNAWLLSFHHGGENVAYIESDAGVIVLGVGLEQGRAILDAIPYPQRTELCLSAPEPFDW